MIDLSAAPKLKPAFLLNNVVVVAYVKHIGKFNPQEQLDTFFQSQATQNGKKVDGLETAEFNSTYCSTAIHYNVRHNC